MSTTFLKHASEYAQQIIQENTFGADDWVLEIASNDGYLLKNFLKAGITSIGVEPAENVAQISKDLGINTISEFFSSELAKKLLDEFGYPKLIVANNVLAHVPDLIDFVKGLSILCGQETQISIENPTLANILVDMQFDTIYHEHYSYLSATSVQAIGKMHDLNLFRVEHLKIHGGSNRYWLRSAKLADEKDESVERTIATECEKQLFNSVTWLDYSSLVSRILKDFHIWLSERKKLGKKVYGYGAAAKASTILNAIAVEPNFILKIADISLEKQERYMPPHGIKIISPEELFSSSPTDVVIFPWNIKSEIADFLRKNLGSEVALWCAIPKMHEVEVN
jgi:hypothetical protein